MGIGGLSGVIQGENTAGVSVAVPAPASSWKASKPHRPESIALLRGKQRPRLPHIQAWMVSDHTDTVRFGIGMLMPFYLDDAFST